MRSFVRRPSATKQPRPIPVSAKPDRRV